MADFPNPGTAYTEDPWTNPDTGGQYICTDVAKLKWRPYSEGGGGGSSITINGGTASTEVSGVTYYWPVFETDPNA